MAIRHLVQRRDDRQCNGGSWDGRVGFCCCKICKLLCHFNQIGKLQLLMIKPRWLSWKVYLKQYPTYSLWLKPLCYRRLFDCLISLFQLFWATNMNVGMWQLQVLEVATSPVISLKIILRCCKRFFGTVENAQISPHFRQFCAQRLGE